MKPSIPKGTRDFSPTEMVRRNFIFDTIKKVYQKFGFQQIETPAMENLSTLEGKYGEEGDKLLFRILNSGPILEEIRNSQSAIRNSDITEKGLRYDLTVPFARYVVMHQNEITFPFKRYQMQPVWRADRPQKGRYREFYQCDADVIGSTSLLNEVELIQIIDEVFSKLGVGVTIKINNRKVLIALAKHLNIPDEDFYDFVSILDKKDRIDRIQIIAELKKRFNVPDVEWHNLFNTLFSSSSSGANANKIGTLENMFASSEIGIKGTEEMKFILFAFIGYLSSFAQLNNSDIEVDLGLARGLNYYTGTIIEVKVNDPRSTFTSSICGGGRYDDLTGIFGLPNVSGVGISFGVDRIYDVMDELKLFDKKELNKSITNILFINYGGDEEVFSLNLLKQLRDQEINAEIYPDPIKPNNVNKFRKKQIDYAIEKGIPFVAIYGPEEKIKGVVKLKTLALSKEDEIAIPDFINLVIDKIKSA